MKILNGDPNYVDNWHDIIGYAKLIEDRLRLAASPVPNENDEIIAKLAFTFIPIGTHSSDLMMR